MSGTMRRKPNKRKAFYRDFARRSDRKARTVKAKRNREMTRAASILATLQGPPDAPDVNG
jgi:hypothetical protein